MLAEWIFEKSFPEVSRNCSKRRRESRNLFGVKKLEKVGEIGNNGIYQFGFKKVFSPNLPHGSFEGAVNFDKKLEKPPFSR